MSAEMWKEMYDKYVAFWKKSEEKGLKDIGRAYAKAQGRSEAEGEKLFTEPKDYKKPKITNCLKKICSILYVTTSLFFVLSILIFAGYYIFSSHTVCEFE